MRLMKWILGLLVGLAALFAVGGMLLPDRSHVEREILIERPPAQVFAFLDGFTRFQEWSPWAELDPAQVLTLSGPPRGAGARMEWRGEQVGSGAQTVIAVDPERQIDIALDFGEHGAAIAHYRLSAEGDATRLVWSFDSDAEGRLADRWMGLLFESMIGADYERGLARLKQVIETDPPAPTAVPPSVTGEAASLPSAPASSDTPAVESPAAGATGD